jgi:hypothetical protein
MQNLGLYAGSEGGKGGYNRGTFSVTPGQSYQIVVGIGGCTAGSGSNPGGSTSFDTLITAPGGGGAISGPCGGTKKGTDGITTNWPYDNWTISTATYIPNYFIDNSVSIPALAPGGPGQYGTCGKNGFVIISY